MTSAFPGSLDSFSTSHADGINEIIHAATINDLADAVNKIEAFLGLGGILPVLNLVTKYGVSTSNSAATNKTQIQQALNDAAVLAWAGVGPIVYLPGAGDPYPCDIGINLPPAPITWMGDGRSASVLKFPQFSVSGQYAVGYINTVGAPTTGPFHYTNSTRSTFGALHWTIRDLGFEGGDWVGSSGYGFYFPNWDASVPGHQALTMDMIRCSVKLFFGTGIYYLINGLEDDSSFFQVTTGRNSVIGGQFGSDTTVDQLLTYFNGNQGYYNDGRNTQLANSKSYSNGEIDHTMPGFHWGAASAGINATNLYAQDEQGEGFRIENVQRFSGATLTADRCCWNGTVLSGLTVKDSTDVDIAGYLSTDSYTGSKPNRQMNALKVTNTGGNTNARNRIVVKHSQSAVPLGPAVDPTSDLNGTDVVVGGSGGGQYTLTFGTTITPDPYLAQHNVVTMTANITTVAAPANAHKGARLRLTFIQNGTGGFTLPTTWDAVYKLSSAISNTGNTASKRTFFEFEYDGTNWVQLSGANIWF